MIVTRTYIYLEKLKKNPKRWFSLKFSIKQSVNFNK